MIVGAFGDQGDLDALDILALLLQHGDDVDRGAAAHAHQHDLHRPRGEVATANVGGAVHRERMAAAALGDEQGAVDPGDLGGGGHAHSSLCLCFARYLMTPWKERTSCSVIAARCRKARRLCTMAGRIALLRRKPDWSSARSRWAKRFRSSSLVAGRVACSDMRSAGVPSPAAAHS